METFGDRWLNQLSRRTAILLSAPDPVIASFFSVERLIEHAGDEHKGLAERLEFSPGGEWLVSAGGDHEGFFKFLSIPGGQLLHQEKAPMHVHDFMLDPSADGLLACGHGKLVAVEFKTAAPAEVLKS